MPYPAEQNLTIICQPDNNSGSIDNKQMLALIDLSEKYEKLQVSENSKKIYENGWKTYLRWCAKYGMDHLRREQIDDLVSCFLASEAESGRVTYKTLELYALGIVYFYGNMDIDIHVSGSRVKKVMHGIRRSLHHVPNKKEPILIEDLREMIKEIPLYKNGKEWPRGYRNRAMLLLCFSGAFRRSEVTSLNVEDLSYARDGMRVMLRRSKTDQLGQGHLKLIPYGKSLETCPVLAVKDWLKISKIRSGPIFRGIDKFGRLLDKACVPVTVEALVKNNPYIRKLGSKKYAGHSLRAGFVTTAVMNKVDFDLIMQQTGHDSYNSLRDYIRRGRSFSEAAAGMVGL